MSEDVHLTPEEQEKLNIITATLKKKLTNHQAAAYAFSLVYLGYATSVFRLSILFIIIIGGVFLKEERIKERLLGGAVMVIGAILISL